LSGSVPNHISSFTNLLYLNLQENNFNGPLPTEIGELSKLWELNLGSNQISGAIPSSISGLVSLKTLHLCRNSLVGSIPDSITSLGNLTRLVLEHNNLSGQLPTEIGRLTSLLWLHLSHNRLCGGIPDSVRSLERLRTLDLSHNQLSGEIPPGICMLSRLIRLQLNNNCLGGPIHPDIGALTKLELLDLSGNHLEGDLPDCFRTWSANKAMIPLRWERALDELNFYRKLLQMDPLTTMDAFELSSEIAVDEPALCLGSVTRSASFEAMPPEILDRIVQFVDSDSILPLCHALPYYKYISTAMVNFAHRFPEEKYTPSKLWPDMHLPIHQSYMSEATDFPIQHLHAVGTYARIISKNSGNVHVPCSQHVLNYLGALPDVLSLCPGDSNYRSSVWVDFLRGLADSNKQIRSCEVDGDSGVSDNEYDEVAEQMMRLQIQSLIFRDDFFPPIAILDALPFIKGLSYFATDVPGDCDENDFLSRCVDLKEIEFLRLLGEEPVGQADYILQLIEGSRIQKVWCEKPSPKRYKKESKALQIITSVSRAWLAQGKQWCY
ncbi:hypothetical protein CcCBS67573_g10518, partial [Chytriomyces confervae]